MLKTRLFLALALLATSALCAQADDLLVVDLSVADQVTISATSGLSAATVSGSDTTGFYLASIYNGGDGITDTLVSGDLTSAENTSDGTPLLFRLGADPGLNVFSFTDDPDATFTAGTTAFSGSATWTIDADDYADLLGGNASGDVYFPADTEDDVAGATLIGTYTVVVPEPTAVALVGLGLAGLGLIRRR